MDPIEGAEAGVRAKDTPRSPHISTLRERIGWYLYDCANSAFYLIVVTVFLGPYLTGIAKTAAGCVAGDKCAQGFVYPLGIKVAAGSFYPYVVSLSVFLTVFTLPVVGAIADRSEHKRRLLGVLAFVGAAATMGFAFVEGDRYLLGGILFMIANISLGASVVVYNAFLPRLASPDRRDAMSSIGFAVGYVGSSILLVANLAAYLSREQLGWAEGTVVKWCIVSAGAWWALFTIFTVTWLPEPPPLEEEPSAGGNALTDGFRQLWSTVRGLKKYPLTLFFLLAFLVYNDGIQTVVSTASLYATEELKIKQSTLIFTILLIQIVAFLGALGLGALATHIGAWKTVLLTLVGWTAIVIAAFWLPVGKDLPFMIVGMSIGIVQGGSQALSRSLFSQLIPQGREAEYYGFYEISDKGTSWLGPIAFGLAFQMSGSYRIGLITLLTFFVIGFVALLAVPIRKAVIAAGNTPPRVL